MSEMIIPTLAARKAARKKSQLTENDTAMTPETIAPSMPASFVEPTVAPQPQATATAPAAEPNSVTTPTPPAAATPALEAAHTAPPATAQAQTASTTGVAAATARPSTPVVNSAPTAAFTAPVTGPAHKEISVQSILPTTTEIAKSVEKSKTAPALSAASPALSKEMLAKLASEMGFELAKPKREFTKHTYSITPWHKDTMKQYTDVLGIAMQDAVCEAFDLFFAKHQAEFDAVRKAKGKV